MKLISYLLFIRRELRDMKEKQRQYNADVSVLRDEIFQLRMYFRRLGYNPRPDELNAFGRRPV